MERPKMILFLSTLKISMGLHIIIIAVDGGVEEQTGRTPLQRGVCPAGRWFVVF